MSGMGFKDVNSRIDMWTRGLSMSDSMKSMEMRIQREGLDLDFRYVLLRVMYSKLFKSPMGEISIEDMWTALGKYREVYAFLLSIHFLQEDLVGLLKTYAEDEISNLDFNYEDIQTSTLGRWGFSSIYIELSIDTHKNSTYELGFQYKTNSIDPPDLSFIDNTNEKSKSASFKHFDIKYPKDLSLAEIEDWLDDFTKRLAKSAIKKTVEFLKYYGY